MSFSYREIKKDSHYAREIWDAKQKQPRLFRNASHAWAPDYEAFEAFWTNCYEIWGLFKADDLIACAYIELDDDITLNAHFSVIRKVDRKELVRFFRSLSRLKQSQGIIHQAGWILEKNNVLIRIAADSNFFPTGLKMDYGQSRGRVLRWIQVKASF